MIRSRFVKEPVTPVAHERRGAQLGLGMISFCHRLPKAGQSFEVLSEDLELVDNDGPEDAGVPTDRKGTDSMVPID